MKRSEKFDVVVVGAGVIGLASAWQAAKRGHRVALLERSPYAQAASIRNFGMIWPIGQPKGTWRDIALRSRELWTDLARQADVWTTRCGSLFLIHHEDERAVANEFIEQEATTNAPPRWLDRDETIACSPAARRDSLIGGLFNSTEVGVNPRQAIQRIPQWLQSEHDVDVRFHTAVTHVEGGQVTTQHGDVLEAKHIVVCGGHNADTLFPREMRDWGIYRCKLQMMRTGSQPNGWRIGPHLAGGLTMQHYHSFQDCPSLGGLKERIANETPELNDYGIHVMASQNELGEVILGDSHQYGDDATPFDDAEIERLMLRELNKLIDIPDWEIQQRWHGVYAKHATRAIVHEQPHEGVHVVLLPGGAGMTLSMGVAERLWDNELAELGLEAMA